MVLRRICILRVCPPSPLGAFTRATIFASPSSYRQSTISFSLSSLSLSLTTARAFRLSILLAERCGSYYPHYYTRSFKTERTLWLVALHFFFFLSFPSRRQFFWWLWPTRICVFMQYLYIT